MIQFFAIVGLAAIIFGVVIGVIALVDKIGEVLSRRHKERLQTGSLLRSLTLRVQVLEERRRGDRDSAHFDRNAANDRLDALESDRAVALSQIALLVTQVDEHSRDMTLREQDITALFEELDIVKGEIKTHDFLLGIDDEE